MNRRYMVGATFLGIAACATSGPESTVPGAKVETSVITSNPTAAEGKFEDVDVPEVPKVTNIPVRDEVICRMETTVGSRFRTRVCRTRSEIKKTQRADQDMLEKAQRSGAVHR